MTATQRQEQGMGSNRTGVKASPLDARKLTELSTDTIPPQTDNLQMTRMRMHHAREANKLGSVPPVASVSGVAQALLQALKGNRLTAFIDKLGERLAFERTGVRAYESLIVKLDALGSWDGGPTRELLQQQCNDELGHFHLIWQLMEQLGADPTAMTPSADVAAQEAGGVLKVLNDPRTTLADGLHAINVLEDVDADAWALLLSVAERTGQDDMAEAFRAALAVEEEHKRRVHQWLASAMQLDADLVGDPSAAVPPPVA